MKKRYLLLGTAIGIGSVAAMGVRSIKRSLDELHWDIFDESQDEYEDRKERERKLSQESESGPILTNEYYENPFLQKSPCNYLLVNVLTDYGDFYFKNIQMIDFVELKNAILILIAQTNLNVLNENVEYENEYDLAEEFQQEFFDLIAHEVSCEEDEKNFPEFFQDTYKYLFAMYSEKVYAE